MAFNSFRFVVFCAVVLVGYNLAPVRLRPMLLVIASYLYYASFGASHVLVLALVTASAFWGARIVVAHRRKPVLFAVVGLTVFPLAALKYSHALADLIRYSGVHYLSAIPEVSVPPGLAFYTLMAVGYVADIYMGPEAPELRLSRFALFVAWFPTVLSGPIERWRSIQPQLRTLQATRLSQTYVGAKYALWGFFCKLVVADNLASVVDRVLRAPQPVSGESFWIVFGLFTFQIYFDLAGYTSIAIGVARMFNIRLSRNFDRPYLATSLRDFWWRWHITLSHWFRDYVYLSLGGNRRRSYVRAAQLLVVFVVSGLWHGAAWHFVAWGGLHGTAYVVEEKLRKRVARSTPLLPAGGSRFWRIPAIALTFTAVSASWVFFRMSDVHEIGIAVGRMFCIDRAVPFTQLHEAFGRVDTMWTVGLLCSGLALEASRSLRDSMESIPDTPAAILKDLMLVNWLAITLVLLGDIGGMDFMYTRF